MADREKVIIEFERCIGFFSPADTSDDYFKCVCQRVLELLKEQKSEEPLIIQKDQVDEVYDYIAKCPECGMTWAMWHSEKMRYCPGCGKAVKWDD